MIDLYSGTFSFYEKNSDKILMSIKRGILDKKITDDSEINLKELLNTQDIEKLFDELMINGYFKDREYIVDYFSTEAFGGYDVGIFECIAPYINDGYFDFIDDNGNIFRKSFKDGECIKEYNRILWE